MQRNVYLTISHGFKKSHHSLVHHQCPSEYKLKNHPDSYREPSILWSQKKKNNYCTLTQTCTQLCSNPLISRPGQSQGLLYKHLRNSLINSLSHPFPPKALRRRNAQTVRDSSSSYKIDYVIVIETFLNPEGHQNPISGSKVKAILLKGWISLLVDLQRWRVCDQRGYPVQYSQISTCVLTCVSLLLGRQRLHTWPCSVLPWFYDGCAGPVTVNVRLDNYINQFGITNQPSLGDNKDKSCPATAINLVIQVYTNKKCLLEYTQIPDGLLPLQNLQKAGIMKPL